MSERLAPWTSAPRATRAEVLAAILLREWREALENKLLIGMTFLPPVVILAVGVLAISAAAANPPSERDVEALYAAAPAIRGLDPKEAVQGIIAQYFLILFLMIPTIVPLTIAIYSVIGEKANRTLEPLLATPVGAGELLFAKSVAAAIPAVIVTWLAYGFYLLAVVELGSPAAATAVLSPRWVAAMIVMVPLLTLLSVNLGVLISTRVNDMRVAQQIGGLVVVPVVALGIAQVTGRVVLEDTSILGAATLLLVVDVAVFVLARFAFQRENILSRWR
jgi:ABC-2 type transport system permease protein